MIRTVAFRVFIGGVALVLGIYGFLLVVVYCWIFSMVCLCLFGGGWVYVYC